ncbi:MAG: FMN-binding protein [Acidimicrobiales bacterium]|nr:FMN-binding protein [Acidimicrobiales bacterium]
MDIEPPTTFPPPVSPQAVEIDAATQQRLARLAASRVARTQPAASGQTTPTARQRKRHAAKGSRTAAVLMSITTTAGLTAYFQHANTAAASNNANTLTGVAVASGAASATTAAATTATTATAATSATTAATTATTATAATTAATTAAASAAAGSTLADGTYTGATATNKWGPVQVEITVTNGQITEVVAVQTPTDDRKSISINASATPTLASEVLTAQSANIDTVSGATYTSDSYKASLQSAIDLAQATAAQASVTS